MVCNLRVSSLWFLEKRFCNAGWLFAAGRRQAGCICGTDRLCVCCARSSAAQPGRIAFAPD